MSGAHAEAERIVEDLHLAGFPDRDTDIAAPGLRGALEAMLAAAIKVHDTARHRQSDTRGLHVLSMPVGPWHDLDKALYALRSYYGEATQ